MLSLFAVAFLSWLSLGLRLARGHHLATSFVVLLTRNL
jgi:hypothetical protein